MQLTEIPTDPNELLSAFMREQAPRSTCTHVSDVLRWADNKVEHRGERKPVEQLSAEERCRMALYTSMGWGWEEVIRWALEKVWCQDHYQDTNRYIRLGELEKDGIVGTPDFFDKIDLAIEEFKATWRSSSRDIETDFKSWMRQIKAYCYMLDVTKARLRVYWVNGNWKPCVPSISQWELRFDRRELHDNWQLIKANSIAMRREKEKNEHNPNNSQRGTATRTRI